MNEVSFSGNYGGPSYPDLKQVRSGKSVITVPVFVPRRTESGWVDVRKDVTIWGKLAENFSKSIRMGDRVMVIGRERINQWNDSSTGELRSKEIVEASDIGISVYWGTASSTRQAKDLSDDQNGLVTQHNLLSEAIYRDMNSSVIVSFDGEEADYIGDVPI